MDFGVAEGDQYIIKRSCVSLGQREDMIIVKQYVINLY